MLVIEGFLNVIEFVNNSYKSTHKDKVGMAKVIKVILIIAIANIA